MNNKVLVCDETLRDGQQSAGLWFTYDEALEIAKALDQAKVDFINAGFPVSSQEEIDLVREITRIVKHATITALSRCRNEDIDAVLESEAQSITLFAPVSDILIKTNLNAENKNDVIRIVKKYVRRAYNEGLHIFFGAEDSTRASPDFVVKVLIEAASEGANVVNICDTLGIAMPWRFEKLVRKVREALDHEGFSDVIIGLHTHNDLGLAVANSIVGVHAGARLITGTINGIGERAGNAALEEMIVILKLFMGYDLNFDLSKILELSRLVAKYSFPVSINKPIIGINAFRHESGIHVAALLKNPEAYLPFDPTLVGWDTPIKIVIGKYSGRTSIKYYLENLGIELDEKSLTEITNLIKKEVQYRNKRLLRKLNELYEQILQLLSGISVKELKEFVNKILGEK